MAFPNARRADSAGRPQARVSSFCCIATLLAFAPAAAEPPDDLPVQDVGKVSITATRGERDPLEVAGSTTLLDRADIERTGALTIAEVLRRQPGLFVTNSTATPAGVQVEARGFSNGGALGSSLLVQVDGRRVNEADTNNTDWSLIPLDNIEAIEIVRGPASAIYGDNAIGGVINIRTLPAEGRPRATGRAHLARYDTHGGTLRAAGSYEGWTAGIFFSDYETDGFRDRSGFQDKDVDGSLEWRGDRIAVGAKAGYNDNDREFPGALDPIEISGPRGRRAADPDSTGDESNVESWYGQAWIEAFLADGIQLRIEPQTSHRTDDVLISTLASGQFDIQTSKRAAGVDAQLRVDRPLLGRPNRFIAGFEYLYQRTRSLTTSGFGTSAVDNDREIYSGYIQEEVALTDELLLSAGVRIDRALYDIQLIDVLDPLNFARQTPNFTVWSPRASLNYRFLPSVSGYFSYARGFRLPNFDEDAPFFGAVPDLDEQTSDSLELGFKGESERIAASLALYWMWVDDEILFDPVTFTNTNLDETQHRGIEAAVDVRALDWLSVYGNYTFDDVKITSEVQTFRGHRMPITPRNRGNLGLTAHLPYDVEANANFSFVGRRRLANDFDRTLLELDPYETLDLVLNWRPALNEHISGMLSAGLYNVWNERYDGFGARFEPGAFGFVPTPFLNPAIQRSWRVTLGITVAM